jgi:hypothetical protein
MYGMWQFGILAASLLGARLAIALHMPSTFSLRGWFIAFALLVFAFVGRSAALGERHPSFIGRVVRTSPENGGRPLIVNRKFLDSLPSNSCPVNAFIRTHRKKHGLKVQFQN